MKVQVKQLRQQIESTGETYQDPGFLLTLESLLNTVETELIQWKRKYKDRIELLLIREKQLEADVFTWEDRILAWDQSTSNGSSSSLKGPSSKIDQGLTERNVMPEVVEYDQFLKRNGGSRGGWEEDAHAVFLKLRAKYWEVSRNVVPTS